MLSTIRCISIVLFVSSICSCANQAESNSKTAAPTNEVSSATDASPMLDDDGIMAPAAPTLSISATAGALHFTWVDWSSDTTDVTDINLYQYNNQTEQELELSTDIEPGDDSVTLPIVPHRLAWNAISYRLEICTVSNCVSSLRVLVQPLLSDAVTAVTPSDSDLGPSFGDDLAINSTGNVAVASSPAASSVAVLFHIDKQWIQASTLASQHFSQADDSSMRVSVSASGDTIAISSISSSANPSVVIFDRLGENWIETASISPFPPAAITQAWDTASMRMQLSDDGDRLMFAAQTSVHSVNTFDSRPNQIMIFERSSTAWTHTAILAIPNQHTRLRSISASGPINKIVALSAFSGEFNLHEYSITAGGWGETSTQVLDMLTATVDTQVISSDDASHITVAGWETQSDAQRSAVAWKLEKRGAGWIIRDSIRTPPTDDATAELRLATDAKLQTLAVGWQAQTDANLTFYETNEGRWQHQFSVPNGFNLKRSVPLVQSVVISADNSTTLIGTSNNGDGGLVSSFR